LTLAFVFALDTESAPWRARHPFRRVTDSGQVVYDAQIGPSRVRVAASGIRAPRIRELASTILAGRPDGVVAVGLGGALAAQHAVGDIIVARTTRSGPSGPSIASADGLLALATRCGAIAIDSLLTVDHVITLGREKRDLARHGSAVDMESFAVLSEAAERGIPAVAIRVIGDAADEDIPLDFTRAIRPDGTLGIGRILREAAGRPDRWMSLFSFGLRQRRALRALAGFLDRFVLDSRQLG
jgi:nucleoside phosphorylase